MFGSIASAVSRLSAGAKVAAFIAAAGITSEEEAALDSLLKVCRGLPFLKAIPDNLYPPSARALAAMLAGNAGVLSRPSAWVVSAISSEMGKAIIVPTISEAVAVVPNPERIVSGFTKLLNMAGCEINPDHYQTFDGFMSDAVLPALAQLLQAGEERPDFVSCNACGSIQVLDPANPNLCRICGTQH